MSKLSQSIDEKELDKLSIPLRPVYEEFTCAICYEQMRETHHDHLINLRDGKVIEFTSEEIEKLQTEIARKLGYKLVDHRLELYCVPLDENTWDDDKT